MQAVIMAAGKGRRLGELTEGKPKSFIKIHGKRIIDYNIEMLTTYGINDIIIVTGYKSELFEEMFMNNTNIKLIYNPFYETTNVLTSFWFAQEYLKDDYIYMHADTLCDMRIFEELLNKAGEIVLPIDFKECDVEAMKVKILNDKVVEINKTMVPDSADGEFVGIAKISKYAHQTVKNVVNKLIREKEFNSFFEAALQYIIKNNMLDVIAMPTRGLFWSEIDLLEDLENASKRIVHSNLVSEY